MLDEASERDDVGALVLWGGPRIFAAGADIKAMAEWGPDEVRPSVDALGRRVRPARVDAEGVDRRDQRLRAGGRARARARRRPAVPGRRRDGRPARDHDRGDPGRRGHPAAHPLGRRRREPATSSTRADGSEPTRRSPGLRRSGAARRRGVDRGDPGGRGGSLRGPRQALAAAKAAIGAAIAHPGPDGIGRERRLFLALFGTADQREGMRAFLEKREPRLRAGRPQPRRRLDLPSASSPKPCRCSRGMNRPASPFEQRAERDRHPRPIRRSRPKGCERRGRGEVPGRIGPVAPAAEQAVRRRSRLRRADLRHEALALQQVAVLLAARARAQLRATREAQEPHGRLTPPDRPSPRGPPPGGPRSVPAASPPGPVRRSRSGRCRSSRFKVARRVCRCRGGPLPPERDHPHDERDRRASRDA